MARPFNDKVTKKHDRIIAKVYMQLYRWGFSSSMFEPKIAKIAYKVLNRSNTTQGGNNGFASEEDVLSDISIKKIYEAWTNEKENDSYFLRSNYPKVALQSTAPGKEYLDEVISYFMEYMNQEPERCIFEDSLTCDLSGDYIWWRFHDGELDGDLPLSPSAKKRVSRFPAIKKK